MKVATCTAPTNIAVVKYWGKDDVALNTPLNASVSVTLHPEQLRTTTSVAGGGLGRGAPRFLATRLWLNGQEQPVNKRVAVVLREMRQLAARVHSHSKAESDANQHLHIVSTNSFPTAAGLASSAAGYACLVAALAEFYGLSYENEEFPGQLSTIARQGSGSASRSLDGGFVRWQTSSRPDGKDSCAVQVADETHWPELCAVVCVVNDATKDTSSTTGMQTTKATSPLLEFRAEALVPERIKAMERAILDRDFEAFGKLTMQESNQFHATCLDTMPPIFYLNEVSKLLIKLVHRYNTVAGCIRAAYTFDAGPNAVIFAEQQHVPELVALVRRCFASGPEMPIKSSMALPRKVPRELLTRMEEPAEDGSVYTLPGVPGAVKMLFVSRVGGGTRVLSPSEALVDSMTGEPFPAHSKEGESIGTVTTEPTACETTERCFWATLARSPLLHHVATAALAVAATSAILLRK